MFGVTVWPSNAAAAPDVVAANGSMVDASRVAVEFGTLEQAEAAARGHGARVLHLKHTSAHVGHFVGYLIWEAPLGSRAALAEEMAAIRSQVGAQRVGYDEVIELPTSSVSALTPDDPEYGNQWALEQIGGPIAWERHTDASDVLVLINDTGIRYDHEDLRDNIWVNPGEVPGNGVDDDENGHVDDVHGVDVRNGDPDPMDDAGHGTSCAGIIGAAGDNGVGVAGVAWKVGLVACKWMGSDGRGNASDASQCLEYAIDLRNAGHNLLITSNSWGGFGDNATLKSAFEAAGAAGILNITGAGNSRLNLDEQPTYPEGWVMDTLITAVNSNQSDEVASSANYGMNTVDLAAPGTQVRTTARDATDSYRDVNGSSFAGPHVAGAVALAASYYETTDIQALRQLVLDSVDPVASLEGRTVTGGRLNVGTMLDGDLEPDPTGSGSESGSDGSGSGTGGGPDPDSGTGTGSGGDDGESGEGTTDSAGGTTGPGDSGPTGGGSGSDDGGATGGGDNDAGSCACRAQPTGELAGWGLLGLLGLAAVRRRI